MIAARHPIHRSLRVPHGWSLVELFIALAIAALLISFAGPAYRDLIAAQQLANHAQHLEQTLNQTRSEAIKRGDRVAVCKTRDLRQCADTGSWDMGWIVFFDENRNGVVDEGELVLRTEGPVPNGITVTANRPLDAYVSYTSLGHPRLLNGALQMGTFNVCKSGQNAIHVVLANTGRARIDATKQPCS